MICPDCRSEVRDEYYTAFCLKCLKNINKCLSNLYMDSCVLVKGHAGKHQTIARGQSFKRWNEDDKGEYVDVENLVNY